MKKPLLYIIFTFFLLLFSANNFASTSNIIPNVTTDIENGWYQATVEYTNYSTGTYNTYTLNVYVEYNNVVKIDFGNGGSVHTGYNNEGYFYSGGYLSLERDYSGNVTAATTTVTISDDNGMRYFKIRIE